jgi:hypothetical protein
MFDRHKILAIQGEGACSRQAEWTALTFEETGQLREKQCFWPNSVSLPNGKVLVVVVVVVVVVGGGSSVSHQLNLIQLVSGWCVSLLKLSKLDCTIRHQLFSFQMQQPCWMVAVMHGRPLPVPVPVPVPWWWLNENVEIDSPWVYLFSTYNGDGAIICPVITSLPLATYMHTKQPAYAGTIDSGEWILATQPK